MTPQSVWHFTRRWLWLFALASIFAAASSFFVSSQLPKVYEGTAKLLVTPGQSGVGSNYNDILTAERLTRTYSQVLKTRPMVDAAAALAGINLDYERAAALLDVSPIKDTQLVQVTARGNSPEQAANFANQLAAVFVQQTQASQSTRFAASKDTLSKQVDAIAADIAAHTRRIDDLRTQAPSASGDAELARSQSELSQLQQSYTAAVRSFEDLRVSEARSSDLLLVVEPAAPTPTPVAPRILLNVLLAAILGLAIGAGIAFAAEHLDDRLSNPERLTRFTGLHALGSVALAPTTQAPRALDLVAPKVERVAAGEYAPIGAADSFQLLRANLQFAAVERPFHTLLVTSASAAEGKTTSASSLAVVLAQAGQTVLLVDADLRRPAVHTAFGLSNRNGLTTLLVSESVPALPRLAPGADLAALGGTIRVTPVERLWVLPSGPLPPNPSELLASLRMRKLLGELSRAVDVVILDSAPVLPVSDPAVLTGIVDATLVVVNSQKSRGQQVAHAVATLQNAGGRVVGAVLNRVPARGATYGYYGSTSDPTTQVVGSSS
jgi:succinoglycan biosynthesis transport protein ExoP